MKTAKDMTDDEIKEYGIILSKEVNSCIPEGMDFLIVLYVKRNPETMKVEILLDSKNLKPDMIRVIARALIDSADNLELNDVKKREGQAESDRLRDQDSGGLQAGE